MGQIIGRTAKPDACNLRSLSSFGTPAAGQHILVSTDNSAMQNGQGNFDAYVVGDGHTAAAELPLIPIDFEKEIYDSISYEKVKADEAIVITDNEENVIGVINQDGADFNGLKKGGLDVLTANDLPDVEGIIQGGSTTENKVVITDDEDNEVVSIGNDGLHAKELFVGQTPVSSMLESISISLPDKIYAVVGDTLQIFYRGCIAVKDIYKYDILVVCSKGKQFPRYFEYTPTANDVGTTTFTLKVRSNGMQTIAQKTCTLVTKRVVGSPSTAKKILCFGDSLTAGGAWCAEASRRLIGSGGTPAGDSLTNISFVGMMTNNGVGFCGKSGWQWSDFTTAGRPAFRFFVSGVSSLSMGAVYTNNGHSYTIVEINVTNGAGSILCSVNSSLDTPSASGVLTKSSGSGDSTITFSSTEADSQNPLWDYDNSVMTFVNYANTYCGGTIDVVYTLLSWNGQSAGKTDFSDVLAHVKTFADTLHSEFPNAKLKIMGLQVPSVTGGFGANYGATGVGYADGYGMLLTALNQNKAFQDFANQASYSSFVEFVNVSAEFDSEYNMPYEMHSVNTRNTATEMLGTNGVHPSANGQLQIGDVVYRNLVSEICQ